MGGKDGMRDPRFKVMHNEDELSLVIPTGELNRINPFDYLMAREPHAEAVAQAPTDWFPWNYRAGHRSGEQCLRSPPKLPVGGRV